MMGSLQKTFEKIRNDFFPRWDKNNSWQIELDSNLPGYGRCYKDKKKIVIQGLIGDKDELDSLLIHEIAHAVTTDGHGQRWQSRYLKAAEHAKKMGRESLAQAICDEVGMFQSMSPPPNAEMIYEQIQDLVLETEGRMPYEAIIAYICNGIGLYPEEMEKRFKKSKQVYDLAIEDY